jgi:hypothetical protein
MKAERKRERAQKKEIEKRKKTTRFQNEKDKTRITNLVIEEACEKAVI